ncbi:Uncharacterised protein [Turicibacter sanguinis]|nr:Uncharacterised protein [Turicibacter sanguinis]
MKGTFLILGSMHLDNPNNRDLYQIKNEGIKLAKRQAELQELIDCLARFKPTKIALEISRTLDTNLEQDYHSYLEGNYQLGTNEKHQIGFKLAKQLGHNKLYAVDWNEALPHVPAFFNWAIENNPAQWQEQEVKTRQMIEKNQILINTKTIREAYLELNQPEAILDDHRQYNEMVLMRNEEPVGTQWVAWYWYYRNLLVYNHLTELIEDEDKAS